MILFYLGLGAVRGNLQDRGFKTIYCGSQVPQYAGFFGFDFAGGGLGYFDVRVIEIYELVHGIEGNRGCFPDFAFGARNQEILEAMDESTRSGSWVPAATGPISKGVLKAGKALVYLNASPINRPTVFCGSNSIDSGIMNMEELGKCMGGKGNIVILMGELSNEATRARTDGIKKVIKEKFPDIKVTREQTANWNVNAAYLLAKKEPNPKVADGNILIPYQPVTKENYKSFMK